MSASGLTIRATGNMQANAASMLEFALTAHNVQFARNGQGIQVADSGLVLSAETIERSLIDTAMTVQLNITASSDRLGEMPYLSHGHEPEQIPYSDLFRQLKQLFEGSVAPGPHWVSVFYASMNGSTIAVDVSTTSVGRMPKQLRPSGIGKSRVATRLLGTSSWRLKTMLPDTLLERAPW
jgi:hypothetical protein